MMVSRCNRLSFIIGGQEVDKPSADSVRFKIGLPPLAITTRIHFDVSTRASSITTASLPLLRHPRRPDGSRAARGPIYHSSLIYLVLYETLGVSLKSPQVRELTKYV